MSVGVCVCVWQEYITHVDPMTQLGLTSDSVEGYTIGDVHRPSCSSGGGGSGGAALTPELLPCGYLVGDSNTISIQLRGEPHTRSFPRTHTCVCVTRVRLCRREQRQRGRAGLRHAHPQAHAAALRRAAPGAPPRHPLGTQRDREDLPGQSAVPTPAADGGATLDPARRGHLQRGSQVRQSESRPGGFWQRCGDFVVMVWVLGCRSCVSICPAWRSSAAASRGQGAPWWSFWITCTTSALWGRSSTASSTAATSAG